MKSVLKEKNTPNIHHWSVTQFNDLIAEKCQVFLYFLTIGIKMNTFVDKHVTFPDAAAAAKEAVGKTVEEDF